MTQYNRYLYGRFLQQQMVRRASGSEDADSLITFAEIAISQAISWWASPLVSTQG